MSALHFDGVPVYAAPSVAKRSRQTLEWKTPTKTLDAVSSTLLEAKDAYGPDRIGPEDLANFYHFTYFFRI